MNLTFDPRFQHILVVSHSFICIDLAPATTSTPYRAEKMIRTPPLGLSILWLLYGQADTKVDKARQRWGQVRRDRKRPCCDCRQGQLSLTLRIGPSNQTPSNHTVMEGCE